MYFYSNRVIDWQTAASISPCVFMRPSDMTPDKMGSRREQAHDANWNFQGLLYGKRVTSSFSLASRVPVPKIGNNRVCRTTS